jgi:hypothetical protein
MTALVLSCQVCGKPITGKSGYAAVDKAAAAERGRAFRDWRATHPGVPPWRGPKPVRWRLVHTGCDTACGTNDFVVPCERMRTLEQLVVRTVALAERPWFVHADWRQLVKVILKHRETA